MRHVTSALTGALLAGGLTFAGLAPASAVDVTLDFGNIGADGGAVCSSGCVLPGQVEHTFTLGAVTVGAYGVTSSYSGYSYVTQKPGSFEGPGETGIGESDTYPSPSNSDFEINPNTGLVLDNLTYNTIGFRSVSLTIESMQGGEGAYIYGSANGVNYSFLGSLNGADGVTQSFNTGAWNYLGVTGWNVDGNHPDADIAIAIEVVSTSVPEPSTWAMMMLGFAGLGFASYRKAKGPAVFAA